MKKRVLIVDDSATSRQFLKKELGGGDFEIDEAESGEKALKMLRSTPYSLMTLDIEMPGMDGFQVCQKIREGHKILPENQFQPIIFLTSTDSLEGRLKGFKSGASEFLGKKFPEGELLKMVNRMLFPEKKFENLTVLVVDDSRVARAHASLAFKRQGVNIVEADNGETAFEILARGSPVIDIVITDQDMPRLSGIGLCQKIRNDLGNKDIPVIFLTAENRPKGILEIFKAGATDYLAKPYIVEELLARVGVRLEACDLKAVLRQHIDELRELHKQKDLFLSACSHDFKTPLNTILGYSVMLKKNPQLDPEVVEDLERIYGAGELLLKMVQNILDLTHFRNDKELSTDVVDLRNIFENSFKMNQPFARKKGIKMDLNCSNDRHAVNGDSVELTRLFNNILNNAVKFTDPGGLVSLFLKSEGDQIAVTVQDTGIGIPEDKIPHLFSHFSKASRKGTSGEKGSGLGLSIANEIIERHGGSIDVESEVDVGTTIRIKFTKCGQGA